MARKTAWTDWGWGRAAMAVVLLAAVWGIYGGTRCHGWVAWDDNAYIYENEWVMGGLTWRGLEWAWTTGTASNWHPLTWMSLMLDWELFGNWAGGGHLETAALHWVNALLLWWVLGRLTGRWGAGWWVALLWAVHPLRVESVAWASERKDVLSVLFGLAAVGTYAGKGAEKRRTDGTTGGDGCGRMGRGRMWGVAGWMAASLMCKPTMVTLPCLLLLLDAWPLERWRRKSVWPPVREKWPLWAVAAMSCVATLVVQQGAMASVSAVGIGERVATALTAYGWYLAKWLWPTGLAFFYPRPWAGVTPAGAAGCGVLLAAVSAGAAWAWRKKGWGWLGVGWMWFLGALVPMIGLVQVGAQVWADRYSYWPEIGLWMAVVYSAEQAIPGKGRAWRRCAAAGGMVWVVALGWSAREQVATWKDNASLFGRALAATTENATAEGNWGTVLASEDCWGEAVEHLESAVRLNPGEGKWWYQLGTARYRLGDREGAQDAWRQAVLVDGEQWEAMNNLAWVGLEEGRPMDARAWMDRAMENDEARGRSGVWDTEAAVRRAEGDEEGAREAERRRDQLRDAQCTMQNAQ